MNTCARGEIEEKGNQEPGIFPRILVNTRKLDATKLPKGDHLPKKTLDSLKLFSDSVLILRQEPQFNV